MTESELKALESKVDQLISLCTELNLENQALKAEQASWQRERQSLIDKNHMASDRGQAAMSNNSVSVSILDKEYQVACPEEQQAELIISAKYLDQQMRAIRDSGKVVGLERIAVMAALNISYELLKASEQEGTARSESPAAEDGVSNLNRKLDRALQELRQLQI